MLDKKLFLPITNLIYSSGGKFYILAPNTKKKLALEEIKKELENKFLETYEGSLGISIAAIELNGNDLKYNENLNEHPISEKWNELNLQVEKKTKI
jgi:CRISPR-associated protein Csm1